MALTLTAKKKPWPTYTTNEEMKGLRPGLYLALFHGTRGTGSRPHMDDFGFGGPVFGPLKYVHTTYACAIKFEFVDSEDARPFEAADPHHFFSGEGYGDLSIVEDTHDMREGCVEFDHCLYGDWTVFTVAGKNLVSAIDKAIECLAWNPADSKAALIGYIRDAQHALFKLMKSLEGD